MPFDPTRLVRDPRAKGLLVAFASAALALLAVPPEQAALILVMVVAAFGVYCLGISYERGKEVEGTVPDGRVAARPPVSLVIGDAVEQHPEDPATSGTPPRAGRVRVGMLAAIACIALIAVAAGGCTSQPFKFGANRLGQGIARDAAGYNAKEPGPAAAERAAQADALSAATADVKTIELQAVARAWAPVRPWYLDHLNTDPRLAKMPRTKGKYLLRVGLMDQLLDAERKLRDVLGLFGRDAVERVAERIGVPAAPTATPAK
ncbi:MAG TPA: hypothetical protein VK324_15540 [Tepidisphaeraceae bacterium]|nr:hypothetical protein [Tepidisphaeraceae bacterium]